MSLTSTSLAEQVRAWIADDPDPHTRAELERLLESGADEELADRFREPLAFGTAGLRGLIGGGSNRMNRRVVLRTTAALCEWLLESVPHAATRGLCVGYDARTMSREFAADVAEVVMGHGILVFAFEGPTPTPLVAYALLHHGAAAAVTITASHNPPAYNGYKVFWSNGAQIVPPHDAEIARRIEALGSVASIPCIDVAVGRERGLYRELGATIVDSYLGMVTSLPRHAGEGRDLPIVYTALHGVGGSLALEALRRCGFHSVEPVPEQHHPDPHFATLTFPNPEEPGTLALALAQAETQRAQLVLANDPDADRLAAAARDAQGAMVVLDGNEIGCLLADYLLRESASQPRRCVVSTVVSSRMLGAIAREHGARWVQTLSGHKWIQNRVLELEADGWRCALSYEEALGYAPSTAVRDKDGIAAAVVLADLAGSCRARGQTLLDRRDELAKRHGVFASHQVSRTLEGGAGAVRLRERMRRLRQAPPREIGGVAVARIVDLLDGSERAPMGPRRPVSDDLGSLPRSDVLIIECEGHRVALRPSGTEPKLKYYFEVHVLPAPNEALVQTRERAAARMRAFEQSFFDFAERPDDAAPR